MQALDFLLPQPHFDLSPEKQVEFETLFDSTPAGSYVNYQLIYPKWQFLSYLCKSRHLVLHGSQYLDIDEVEPRKANDIKAFSGQNAIYATTDGIWVIYFAIIDRKKFHPLSLFNSCLVIRISPDQIMGPLYFFSITHSALLQKPWCDGAVYILPRENFEQEPAQQMSGVDILFPHWIGSKPAKPIAKLHVQPQDFPFLTEIHGHNDEKLVQLARADPNGFPWPEALVT
jgi:hypothetical protein